MIEENVSSLVPSQQSLARLESVTEQYKEERYGDNREGAGDNDHRASNVNSNVSGMNSMNSVNSKSSNISDNNQTKSDHHHPLKDPLAKQHPYNHS